MVRSIPKMFLIHSIEYEHYAGTDGWDDDWDDSYTINRVRVEPASRLQRSSNSEGEQGSHVVIADRKHSSHFPDFKLKSRITFNGISREVVDVKPYYAFGPEIHHYELELR